MALLYAKASDGYLASIPVNVMGYSQVLDPESSWQYLPNNILIQHGRATIMSPVDSKVLKQYSMIYPLSFKSYAIIIGSQSRGNASWPEDPSTILTIQDQTLTGFKFTYCGYYLNKTLYLYYISIGK